MPPPISQRLLAMTLGGSSHEVHAGLHAISKAPAALQQREGRARGAHLHEAEGRADTGKAEASESVLARRQEIFGLVCDQMRRLLRGQGEDYDDLVQVAAELAIRDLPSFRGQSRLSTWTFRVCYSVLQNHRRWHKRWLRRFSLTTQGELPELQARGSAGAESLEASERCARVHAALKGLSPKRQAVVILHDIEGMGVDEIAHIVSANVLTVRSRLRDGRRDLGRLLEQDPYFGDEACLQRYRELHP